MTGTQWQNENARRQYPLSELATGVGDSGAALPQWFLADMSVSASVGACWVTGAALTPSVASVCVNTPSGVLFGCWNRQMLASGATMALTAVRGSTAHGTVMFGDLESKPEFSIRFSSQAQSVLAVRCLKPVLPAGVTSLYTTAGSTGGGVVRVAFSGGIEASVVGSDITLALPEAAAAAFGLTRPSPRPVLSVAGVTPDDDGYIKIIFAAPATVGGA